MALNVDGYRHRGLEPPYQLMAGIGRQQPRHVLDADRIGAQVFDPPRQIDPQIQGVHRAHGVGQGALGMTTLLAHRTQGGLQIADVVHGVEHPEHIHSVDRCALHETLHHIVGVVAIPQDVLSPKQHLLRSIGHCLFQFADALPGILPQVADTGIEGRTAPGLQGPETHPIQLGGNRQHVIEPHPGRKQRLMGVAQHHLGDAQSFGLIRHEESGLRVGKVVSEVLVSGSGIGSGGVGKVALNSKK